MADVATVTEAGQVITYTYTVTNTGATTLTNVTAVDDAFTPGDTGDDIAITLDVTTLAPGESATGTLEYVVTQADIDAGLDLVNVVEADSDQTEPVTDPETVTVQADATITVLKVADVATVTEAGQVITYTYTVTNTGATTLTNVTAVDDAFTPGDTGDDIAITLDVTTLAPGESATGTLEYVVTQADIDAGLDLVNVVEADSDQTEPVTDPETVTVQADATITVLKVADVATVTEAGQVITYTYTVTNTGATTLTNVTAVDDAFTPGDTGDDIAITLDVTTLAPGESATGTLEYVVTQADIDAGLDLVNVVEADSDQTEPVTDPETVTVQADATITVLKVADVATVTEAGQVITYTYTVTNTGATTLTNVTAVDDAFTPGDTGDDIAITLDVTTLAPGESATGTLEYVVTQADIDAGLDLVNVVEADSDQTEPVTDPETVTVQADATITVLKVADVATVTEAGQVITYTYTVTNTGATTLTNVTAVDDAFTPGDTGDDIAITLDVTTLAPGESATGTLEYVVTQADIDAGLDLVNVVEADSDQTEPVTDPETVTVQADATITVLKVADVATVTEAGQVITYTYTVTNTGATTLTNVTAVDDAFTPGDTGDDIAITLDVTTLAPGESATGTLEYVVTQADIDAGLDLVNVVEADSDQTEPVTDPETVTVQADATITVLKVADVATVTEAGQVITYTYTVTNTGATTLTNVTAVDDAFTPGDTGDDIAITLDVTTLAPGESATGTLEYVVTQADIDAGLDLVNVVEADSDQTEPVTDPETVTVQADATITVLKVADVATVTEAGQVITYTYTVTNTGATTLTNVTAVDDAFTPGDTGDDIAITLDVTTLAPGESATGTLEYVVTQADIDAGLDLVNVVEADSDQTEPVTDPETVTVQADATITVLKVADVATVTEAGQVITYTYTVTNTGATTLTNVTAVDDAFTPGDTGDDIAITLDVTTLAPGESATGTLEYVVTQADIDAGLDLVNVVEADSDQTEPVTDPETVTVQADATITVLKVADVATVTEAGQVITYTYTVTNTGATTLTNVTAVDDAFTPGDTGDDIAITLDVTTLAPGESATGTLEYVVTQADIDAGLDLVNVVEADSDQTEPVTDPETVTVQADATITVLKVADVATVTEAGQVITYTYTVTNTGATTLTNVTAVDDAFTPGDTGDDIAITLDVTTLAPGESATGTLEYVVTQADIDAGLDLVNVVEADSDQTEPVTDPETVTVQADATITVLKVADVATVTEAGQVITYTYTVTNTGATTLTNVTAVDDAFTPGDTGDDIAITLDVTTLAPGESETGTLEYVVTQADIDAGLDLVNVVEADSDQTEPVTDPETVTVQADATITVLKVADVATVTEAGQVITYTYTVTNTGATTLTNVTAVDDAFTPGDTGDDIAITLDVTTLAPGESATGTLEYVVTQADIDAGLDLVNVVEADSDQTEPVTDPETVTVQADATITVLKVADVATVTEAGQVITYTYTVTNTGATTLTNVTAVDDAFTPGDTGDDIAITLDVTTLAPGESATGTLEYGVTQADIDAGLDLVNVVEADSDQTEPVTDPTVTVQADARRSRCSRWPMWPP